MKPFHVNGPASVELAEAARRYEVRRSGLGVDFFDEDDIYIIAVAHTSRRPGYWKGRG